MLMWIWIAVVVLAVIILGFAVVPLLGRLAGLNRAATRLRRRQDEAMTLQRSAEVLQQTLLGVQRRADEVQEHVAAIKPGH